MTKETDEELVSASYDAAEAIKNFLFATSRQRDRETDWNTILAKIEPKVILNVVLHKEYMNIAFNSDRYHSWKLKTFVQKFGYKNPSLANQFILSEDKQVVRIAFEMGYYGSVSDLDKLAKSSSEDIRAIAAKYCSIETLRGMTGDKSAKIRRIVFERLGPAECVDLMLKDPKADIRSDGVRFAPFGYEKLAEMTGEIAFYPFYNLIQKISAEYLPMVLANRNVKGNTSIAHILSERMSDAAGANDDSVDK